MSQGFDVSSTKQDTRANRSLIVHRLQWCFSLMQTIFLCEAIFNFPWVWKRTCWNHNRYNWNELNNAHIAAIHYGKWNWYILRQLWRMYQMKCILQFAAVPIYVMLVIIRQYQFSCVDDYNHVHYTAHIFWSRYAYSGKHHARSACQ